MTPRPIILHATDQMSHSGLLTNSLNGYVDYLLGTNYIRCYELKRCDIILNGKPLYLAAHGIPGSTIQHKRNELIWEIYLF